MALKTHLAAFCLLTLSAVTAPALTEAALAQEALTVDLVNEPSSLDPHKQWNPDSYYVYRNIFDNLLTRDNDGKIIPQVATEWEYLSDTEVVFTIRDDITFHDGEPLTAEDVAFSINRIIDPEFGSPQLGQFNKILSAEVVEDGKVEVVTDGPYPVLLAQLVKLSIVPKHVVEEVGDDAFNAAPVGSGPYKFEEWNRGVSVTLSRNEDYWGDQGPFETAEFRAVPDASTRMADLQSGNADLIVTIDADMAAQIEASGTAKVLTVTTERVGYLKLNPSRAPLDDERVRKAIAHAVDKELIIQGLLGGFDKPTAQMASQSHFGYIQGIESLPYDPEEARRLVEETGAGSTKLSFATSPVFDQRIVQAIAQMLTDVGFDVEIELTDMATYLQRVQSDPSEQPHMSFGRWSCACQDVDGVLFPLLHSSSSWSAIEDPELDAQLEAARNTLDEQERLEAYENVSRRVAEEVLLLPLYEAAILYGAANELEWQPTANESMFLNRMSWAD